MSDGRSGDDRSENYRRARAMLTLPCLGGPCDGKTLAFDQLPGVQFDADVMRSREYVRAELKGRTVWLWQDVPE